MSNETNNHLLILCHSDPLPFRDLKILQSAKNVMLHNKVGLHAELCALFDSEGFLLQSFDGTGSSQIDRDVWTALDFECECFDHTAALVFGIDGNCWG